MQLPTRKVKFSAGKFHNYAMWRPPHRTLTTAYYAPLVHSLMSHRLGGTNRYSKHSTGGCNGGSVDHVEVTSLKPQPPYLKGKVKSISETDLGKSLSKSNIADHHHQTQHLTNSVFNRNNQAFTHDQATASLWKHPKSSPTNSIVVSHDAQRPKGYAQSVLDKPHRHHPITIRRNKSNDVGIGTTGHKIR